MAPGLDDNPGALKPAAHALFKKLKDKELELLLRAVELQGAGESGCVWVEARGSKAGLPAAVLLCRLYRWPDLRNPHELKRLSCCQSAGGEGTVHCCNPHHLSRLTPPGEEGWSLRRCQHFGVECRDRFLASYPKSLPPLPPKSRYMLDASLAGLEDRSPSSPAPPAPNPIPSYSGS